MDLISKYAFGDVKTGTTVVDIEWEVDLTQENTVGVDLAR